MAYFRKINPYDPGYALPPSVLAEPPGRGTLTSRPLPRKTIGAASYSDDFALPGYVKREQPGRGAAYTHQLPGGWPRTRAPVPPALGDAEAPMAGRRVADWIMATIGEVPAADRGAALKAALDSVEPGLYRKVTTRAEELVARGVSPDSAARHALAHGLSEGITFEIARLGRQGMDGFWGDLWGGIKSAPGKAAGWVGKAVKEVGKAACAVASNPASGLAAGAATGNPAAGVAGQNVAAKICAGNQPPPPVAPAPGVPGWVLPVALGGVGLVAVILLTR